MSDRESEEDDLTEDTLLDEGEANMEQEDVIEESYEAEVEESESNASEWADEAAEAIADDIDDFDAGSSLDAS